MTNPADPENDQELARVSNMVSMVQGLIQEEPDNKRYHEMLDQLIGQRERNRYLKMLTRRRKRGGG